MLPSRAANAGWLHCQPSICSSRGGQTWGQCVHRTGRLLPTASSPGWARAGAAHPGPCLLIPPLPPSSGGALTFVHGLIPVQNANQVGQIQTFVNEHLLTTKLSRGCQCREDKRGDTQQTEGNRVPGFRAQAAQARFTGTNNLKISLQQPTLGPPRQERTEPSGTLRGGETEGRPGARAGRTHSSSEGALQGRAARGRRCMPALEPSTPGSGPGTVHGQACPTDGPLLPPTICDTLSTAVWARGFPSAKDKRR